MKKDDNIGRRDRSSETPQRSDRLRWDSFQPDTPVVPFLDQASAGVNQIRLLALNVEKAINASGRSGYFLTVTGADAGTGKSLTAMNLAIILAKKGERRVLVVEGDVWRPSFRKMLKIDPQIPDLADILKEGAHRKFDDAIISVWSAGIDVLTVREDGADPDLMNSQRFEQLLDQLRSRYEIVIFDSPPAFMSEGRLLADRADGVLVVARAGKTKESEIVSLLSEIPKDRCLGLVLNDAAVKGKYKNSSYAYSYSR